MRRTASNINLAVSAAWIALAMVKHPNAYDYAGVAAMALTMALLGTMIQAHYAAARGEAWK